MNPIYQEFYNDEEVAGAVNSLKEKGVDQDNIYVVTHDNDRTERLADNADANTIGLDEQNFGTAAKNVFRKKGDELRAKFDEVGFTKEKADELEGKLDEGKVIVVVKDAPAGMEI
ncbi:general stress protein [Salipaludibacillus aurantiacus]|uniref:Heat induced stress protein YflT n=1 Tax=Salipaludibacillus aurantiacus TaxID=1601833 RepID=A0A1H9X650_9BACI|nr:general stress protein [Salipaludibacillus aurantiacus]SES41612.1 Heat induced stress protein YflT [Salipaludibacillus aurantiacus]